MTERSAIRVLLADDHPIVRQGLAQVLGGADDIDVVGQAETGEEALFLCGKLSPDVVLMDVKMDGLGGIEATRLIHQHHESIAVIGLSTFPQQDIVSAMKEAGACGYILKDISAAELINGIRQARAGEAVFSPNLEARQKIDGDLISPRVQKSDQDFELGTQQKRVLLLMTKGLTNGEIAEHIGISLPTARYHVSAILKKLDVSNRAEAVALATRESIVSEDDL